MSSLPNKPTKSNPPFYFFEGKGWKIDTKIKTENGFKKLSRCWYRTLREAKDDFQAQVDALLEKHTYTDTTHRDASWADFRDTYLDYRRAKVRGSTLAVEKTWFKNIFDQIMQNASAKLAFKPQTASEIQRKVRSWDANRKNKNKVLSYYLHMLDYAFEHEYIEFDHDYRKCKSEITLITSTEMDDVVHERSILTSEECDRLLDAITDAKDKMLTTLMAETGVRIGEALIIRVSDFDFEALELNVERTQSTDEYRQRKEYNRTKTRLGLRKVPFSPQFASVVMAYCNAFGYSGNDYLFPSKNDNRITMDGVMYRVRLRKYCEQAGVPSITPHSLRHTFCTRISERCVTDADRIARSYMMGHSVAVDEAVYAAHNQVSNAHKLIGK